MKKFFALFMAVLMLFALTACTTVDAEGNTVDSTGQLIMTVGMLVVMVLVFYFMIIRPQKKQEKETAKMLDELTPGDTISTVGGIIGVVLKIKDDMVLIETGADRTRLQIAKWAVRKVEEKAND
jgi:preprotein translocase subunit YajC